MADEPVQTNRRGRSNAAAALACLLVLLALIIAGWAAWQQRWLRHNSIDNSARTVNLEERVVAAEREVAAARVQQQGVQRQLEDVQGELRAARDARDGLDQRMRNLETAIGQISSQQLQGREALLLDDAEFLLRAGRQRWDLFNDADAAARAYTLADDALAQVSDQVYAPVRSAIAAERAALVAASSPARVHALDTLAALRQQASGLPIAGSAAAPHASENGVLARTWRALSGVLRVERDKGASPAAADARIARELLALDLAQAQASLLAFDETGFRDAVHGADALLAARFDTDAAGVRTARSHLQALSVVRTATVAPQLGGALAQLRALRASHAMQAITPAPATSAVQP